MSALKNSYRVILLLSDNTEFTWEGFAIDESEAETIASKQAPLKVLDLVELEEFDQFETISEYEAYQRYDDMLDECYSDIEICGYTYSPSVALKRVDEIAYNVGFSDFVSNLESEHNIIIEE